MEAPPCRFIPLGGLGEIGMNCMVVEIGDDRILVDCGLSFDDRGLGVDVIHADLTYVTDAPEKLRAIVLTHGHEDHLGAVPYLLRELSVPVYGPPYALALLEEKMAWDAPDIELDLHPIEPGDRVPFGPMSVEPYRVTHSMSDCTGLILRTPHGVVVHSGDFKIDEAPTDGAALDFDRLAQVRDEEGGIRLFFSDSTNSVSEGSTGPEHAVRDRLEELVREADERVCVTLFASNGHRLRSLAEVARKTGRKLCLLGRSLHLHAKIGQRLGHLPDLSDVQIPASSAKSVPRGELLVLATGTQGEPRAAFSRLAKDEHPDLGLESGDLVIHSARVIPGHEQKVYGLINTLERRGIAVLWRRVETGIHVSGHAHRDEQRRIIEHLAPRAFVPVHGTYLHLKNHAAIARECGVEEVEVVENGAVLSLGEKLTVDGRVPTGRVYRERGKAVHPRTIKDRALLAELGIAFVTVIIDDAGRPAGPVDLLTRGVCHEEDSEELLDDACDAVYEALMARRWHEDRPSAELVESEARRSLKRFFSKRLRKKPLCYASVLRP
ncbi:MAG: ribonuclease J [Sandaracinaceae bacterium]